MKILILNNFLHRKNKEGLEQILNYLQIDYAYGNDIKNYNIIYSPEHPINTSLYPTKKFIFGPHFSVFPNNAVKQFNNKYNNAIYIQPSEWAADVWAKHYKYTTLPVIPYAFGVNTEQFKPNNEETRTEVILYYKRRLPCELQLVKDFLKSKDITPHIFNYVQRYKQQDYIKVLQKCKWAFWLSAHESQGFALEEALSCDVPLLVWSAKSMKQEYGSHFNDITATTVPYWSKECGEYFYEQHELEPTYNRFIESLSTYQPRKFVVGRLSLKERAEALQQLVENCLKK